jgi:hypothetical protein
VTVHSANPQAMALWAIAPAAHMSSDPM